MAMNGGNFYKQFTLGNKMCFVWFCFLNNYFTIYGQALLDKRILFSELNKIETGIQLPGNGGIKPGSGNVRLNMNSQDFSGFTHYQYGTTIRSNVSLVTFGINDQSIGTSTLSLKRNTLNNSNYGTRIQVRDREDIGGVEFNAGFLEFGDAEIKLDYFIDGGVLFIENTRPDGLVILRNENRIVGTFNAFGFQYPEYTTFERNNLVNIPIGTTIYNSSSGMNEVWDGASWH